jgi:hypothetical protein
MEKVARVKVIENGSKVLPRSIWGQVTLKSIPRRSGNISGIEAPDKPVLRRNENYRMKSTGPEGLSGDK